MKINTVFSSLLLVCSLVFPSTSPAFDFNKLVPDKIRNPVDSGQPSPPVQHQDTGASSRDDYLRQQKKQQAEDETAQVVRSLKVKLESAKEYLDKNDMYYANDQLRLAGQKLEELKQRGYDTSAFQAEYNALQQRAGGANQAVANAANAEQLAGEYKGLLDQVGYGMDGIDRMGGFGISNSQSLYDAAKAAAAKKPAADKALPLVKNSSYPGEIEKFYQTRLPGFVNDGFNKGIKELLSRANKSGSVDDARAADLMCDAVLLLDPANAQARKMKDVVAKTLTKVGGALGGADAVKNAGKIIFSKTPGGPPESSFTGQDFIYATVYFKKPYKGEGFTSHLIIDGDYKLNRDTFYLDKSLQGAASSPLEVAPDPKTAKQSGGKLYTKVLSELAEGMTYKVKIVYNDGSSTLEGGFDLDLSSGSTFAERDKQFEAAKIANTFMQKPGHSNPALEKEIMEVFKRDAAGKGETPVRVVLVEKDWRIQRHPISGAIQLRTIWSDVAVKKDNGKYYVYELTYQQVHNGSSYGKTQYHSIGGTYEIPKENIFK